MRRPVPRDQHPISHSVGGSFVVAAIPAILIFAASYPYAFARAVLVVGGVVVVSRALWRRMATDGLDIPGYTGTIRVEKSGRRHRDGAHVRWSLVIASVYREPNSRIGDHTRAPRSNVD